MNEISSLLYELPGFTISDFCAMELDNMTIFISMIQHYLSMDTKEQTKRNFYKLFSDIPAINRDNYGYFFFEFSINNILLYGKFIFPKPQELINYYKWVFDLADRFEIVYKQNKNRMSKYRYPKTSERDSKFEIFVNEGNSKNYLNKNMEEDFDEKEFNKYIEEIREINFSSKKPYNLKNKYVFKEMINAIPNTKSILLFEIRKLEKKLTVGTNLFQQNTISPSEVVKTNNQIKADLAESADWTRKRFSRSKIGAFFFENGTDPKLCRKKADDLIQKYPTVFSKDLETRTYRIDKDKFKQICADCKLPYPNGIV